MRTAHALSDNEKLYNSGFIVFRKSDTNDALSLEWLKEWRRGKKQDQFALNRALRTLKLPVEEIPGEYNYMLENLDGIPEIRKLLAGGKQKVIHYWCQKGNSRGILELMREHWK
jgi:hypothetical protein